MSRPGFPFIALVLLTTGCPDSDDAENDAGTSGPSTTTPSTSSTDASSTATTTETPTSSESGDPTSTTTPATSTSPTGEPETSSTTTGGGELVWLQNDNFTPADSIEWQIWPGLGDCWAAMYDIDNGLYPFDIVALEVAIGGADTTQTYEVGVWTVDGNNGPGEAIDTAMVEIEGNAGFEPRIDLEGLLDVPTIENGSFAVVMCHTEHMGAPSIGTDVDGTVDAQNNWAYQIVTDEWVQAPDFFGGINGDFIMRTGVRPVG
jgi:hypothetical protein